MKNLLIIFLSILLIALAVPTALADETEETNTPAESASGAYTVFLQTDVNMGFQWFAWTWGEGQDRWVKPKYNGEIYKFVNVDSNVVFAYCRNNYSTPDWSYMIEQTVDIKLDGVNNMVVLSGEKDSTGNLTGYLTYYNEADWTMPTEPTEGTYNTSATNPPATASEEYTQPTEVLPTQPTQTQATQLTQPTGATEPTQRPTGPTQPTVTRPTTESTAPPSTGSTVSTKPPATDPAPKLNLSTATVKCGKVIKLNVINRGGKKVIYSSNNKSVASVTSGGKVSALKKGVARITAKVNTKSLYFTIKVTTSPKLSKSSISIRKGKYKCVSVIGKVSTVNNAYKNTSKAKILSKKKATKLKVKALKKGSTTLKVKVNGVWLKLKVKVK